jgi:hypothetical protein
MFSPLHAYFLPIHGNGVVMDLGKGHFQATGTPMVKILRLHLSAQCALTEITILQLKKLKKKFHCKD